MKILVTGGRKYDNREHVYSILDQAKIDFPELCIIQGGARGADKLAKEWAIENGICCIQVDANWLVYDKKAGSIRNRWMLQFAQPDMVLVFPGHRGTQDMKNCAQTATIPTYFCDPVE